MSRMFGANGRILVLPVDHGMALGNVNGLDDPVELALEFLKLDGVNGILSSLPVARRLGRAGMSSDKFRLVTVDSALQGADGRIWQVAVTKAEDVADEGCDAVKALMAWEDDLSSRARTLSLVASLLEEGHQAGLPVLVEPVASGPIQGLDEGEIERRELESARIALEAGADIIKMRVWSSEACRRFALVLPCPGRRSGWKAERRQLGRGGYHQNSAGPRFPGDIRGPEHLAAPAGRGSPASWRPFARLSTAKNGF